MLEPGGCGRHHRRIEAADRHADQHAEQQLELEEESLRGLPPRGRRRVARSPKARRCGAEAVRQRSPTGRRPRP